MIFKQKFVMQTEMINLIIINFCFKMFMEMYKNILARSRKRLIQQRKFLSGNLTLAFKDFTIFTAFGKNYILLSSRIS